VIRAASIVVLLSLWLTTAPALAADTSVQAPASAPAGSKLEIKWTGAGAQGDFISIDAVGSPETSYGAYAYATSGNPVVVVLPEEPGDYVIRYHVANGDGVVASAPLTITAVTATLKAAPTVAMGGKLTVTWTGPNNTGDFIAIDKPTDPERTYGPYAYAASGNPVTIQVPEAGGDYVVRYHMAQTYGVIGTTPVQVTEAGTTLEAGESAVAGGNVAVTWTGPNNSGDFIAIDKPTDPERTYGPYAYAASGNPVTIRAPDAPGDYVIRYHLAASYRVVGSVPLRITPATASLSAPAEVVAGKVFEVGWKGPDNEGDFITVVESGAAEHRYGGSNGYTRRGNPVRIEAPRTAGDYELRYLTGQSYATLATAKLHVTAGTAPGHLKVVSTAPEAVGTYAAVEFLLDASGSMLQRIGGERRIELARKALIDLTSNVLPANADFALRVFGNKEAGSCRTDLEIPLATLDKAAAVAHIKTINSMNLAKTPIGASLLLVKQDLAGVKGPALVVLVTDGEETCGGDPRAAITALRDAGLDVRVNIVGFAVDEVALKETFEEWARLGNGGFFDAQDGAQLQSAIRATLRARYEVLADGKAVATGTVNGEPIELPAGTYQVHLLGDHPKDVGAATIESGAAQELKF
jgi:hypothetical protein